MTNTLATLRNSSQLPQQVRHETAQSRGRSSIELQDSLAREAALQQQNEDLSRLHRAQAEEFERRLLNGVQMIASLLSAQCRTASPEAAAELTIAINRIVAFGHVHRRLHFLDRHHHVDFKQYLERLCGDLSDLLSHDSSANNISVEGTGGTIPTDLGSPLGFIVSELVTNSAKYGGGKIAVRFETPSPHNHLLSVADDGPGLPAGFRLEDGKGLGMKIIRVLVSQIDGTLRITSGDNGRGAYFEISFRSAAASADIGAATRTAMRPAARPGHA